MRSILSSAHNLPTASKSKVYNATIEKIHTNVRNYSSDFAFLAEYKYTLGADQLTTFGEQELVNSGIKFYYRYRSLARSLTPFFRSAGEDRVVESAENFTQGFHAAKTADKRRDAAYPCPLLAIPEGDGSNNVRTQQR